MNVPLFCQEELDLSAWSLDKEKNEDFQYIDRRIFNQVWGCAVL